MRIDRTISLAVSAMGSQRSTPPIAILMYHSISNRIDARSRPYYKTVTSPARFAEQMHWIAETGAEVVALDNWNAPQKTKGSLRVIITFDDGFADFMTTAFPVLRAQGYCATVFLPTAFIDTGKELLAGQKHLSWADIGRLNAQGVLFGSHTVHHFHLEQLTRQEIDEEVRVSSQTIQEHIHTPVTAFSCPFAFPQAHVEAISGLRQSLTDNGHTVGVTTKVGTVSVHDDPYTLKRLPVNNDDDKELFLAKLCGGYNWVGGLQRAVRHAKKLLHN